ncbi:hypothetical protein [Paenibacillus glacialis]|nr:hypothetical protein [Paenibacillus glacialis]
MMRRLHIGNYILNKLACGGIAFLLLNLITVVMNDYTSSPILPISLEQWVYGIFMMASIVSDAVCALVAPFSRTKSIFLISTWGYIVGFFVVVNGGESPWFSGIVGLGTMLLFYFGRTVLRRHSLTTLVLAWFIPVICLSI